MSKSTLEAPLLRPTAGGGDLPGPEATWTLRRFARQHPWWTTTVGVLVLSAVIAIWARTRPSYDAYGWLVWGYQTLHGSLDLGGAPSWKPLPYLFSVPFALAGHYQLWLWMVTAVAVALAGPVFAGRIVFRLSGGSAAGAVFAGAAVLGLQDYSHYILSAQSDPMLVTFVLAGIDMFLLGRFRWTLVLGVLAALGRPEVWPFLGLFMIWAWVRVPAMRWMVLAGIAGIAFMWFGIPTITNGRPDIAGQLAQKSPRELRHNRFFGTLGRFGGLEYLPVWIAAAAAVAFGALRRDRVVLGLAVGSLAWVIVEVAFAYHGWPALPRYMFEAGAVGAVLAGLAVSWALRELPRVRAGTPRWAGVPVVGVLVAVLVPGAVARLHTEATDLGHERARTHEIALLRTTTDLLGGPRHILDCGQPATDVAFVSALAWLYHTNVGFVGGLQQHVEKVQLRERIPKVLFVPRRHGGWYVQPLHTAARNTTPCRNLNAVYAVLPGHPAGVLITR